MKKLLRKIKLYRMEKRGEAVLNESEFWEFIKTLTSDILPDAKNEFSGNLFCILAFWWAVKADRNVERDHYEILHYIRNAAWLAYTDMPATLENIRTDFPNSPTRQRILTFFEEIDEKRGNYLFLPIVSSIDRHQAQDLLPVYQIDSLGRRLSSNELVLLVKKAFSATPKSDRDCAVYTLALITQNWGTKQEVQAGVVLHKLAATQLRRLYDDPEGALSKVKADADESEMAGYFSVAGQEISSGNNRLILLETLFLTETAIAGPQHFEHMFEIQENQAES